MRTRPDISSLSATRSRPHDDGIVASATSKGWVADRWMSQLENLGPKHASRLARGRTLARRGRTRGLWFSPGVANAEVNDEQERSVSIRVRSFSDAEWRKVFKVLLSNLAFVAQIMEGHLPEPVAKKLASQGLDLFPDANDVSADCDCADYLMPCVHTVAMHHVVAEALDGEPFLLLTLRGRPREQFFGELRRQWGDDELTGFAHLSSEEDPPEGRDWFDSHVPLPAGNFRFGSAHKPGAGLVALGPAPGDADLHRPLTPLYEAGAARALEMALEEHEVHIPEEKARRIFRGRKVFRPPETPGRPSEKPQGLGNLTEAIVNLLADNGGVKSKEIAARLDAPMTEIRQELLELETLGIVYRTGQTRGTMWWLG